MSYAPRPIVRSFQVADLEHRCPSYTGRDLNGARRAVAAALRAEAVQTAESQRQDKRRLAAMSATTEEERAARSYLQSAVALRTTELRVLGLLRALLAGRSPERSDRAPIYRKHVVRLQMCFCALAAAYCEMTGTHLPFPAGLEALSDRANTSETWRTLRSVSPRGGTHVCRYCKHAQERIAAAQEAVRTEAAPQAVRTPDVPLTDLGMRHGYGALARPPQPLGPVPARPLSYTPEEEYDLALSHASEMVIEAARRLVEETRPDHHFGEGEDHGYHIGRAPTQEAHADLVRALRHYDEILAGPRPRSVRGGGE